MLLLTFLFNYEKITEDFKNNYINKKIVGKLRKEWDRKWKD